MPYYTTKADLTAICAKWRLLRVVYPLFPRAESLPKVEDVSIDDDTSYYTLPAHEHEQQVNRLKNDITKLRNDLKLNIIRQHNIDRYQLLEDNDIIEGFDKELDSMLTLFENLVDQTILYHTNSQVIIFYSAILLTQYPLLSICSIAVSSINIQSELSTAS